jgi:SulP family sulfate permease
MIAALAVVAFLPFASSLRELPTAVLAGIVIASVVGQVRLAPLLRLGRLSRPQFVVAATTFALTIALAPHLEWGVIAGIGLAVALHLYRELQLEIVSTVDGSTLNLRPHGVLWFGTAPRLEEEFLAALAEHQGIERLSVHLDSLGRVDLTGALALRGLLARAREAGIETEIVDVRPRWRGLVENVIARDRDPLLPERRLP